MVQKIDKSPMPSKQNFTKIAESDLDSTFERVVFNDKGINYLLSFEGEDENIRTIAKQVFDENTPRAAQFTEGDTTQSVAVGTVLTFPTQIYNPDSIVVYNTGTFELSSGYLYKLSAEVSARAPDGVGVGIEYRWWIDNIKDGVKGASSSLDYDGIGNSDYADLQCSSAVVFVETTSAAVNAQLIVEYVDNALGKGVTSSTDGGSNVLIEVVKKL